MNFNRKEIDSRTEQLESISDKWHHKFQLLGLRLILVCFGLTGLFALSLSIGTYRSILSTIPDIDDLATISGDDTTTIVDTEGDTIQTLDSSDANHTAVALSDIPTDLQNAFIAIEDEYFREHDGLDPDNANTLTRQLLQNQLFYGYEDQSLLSRLTRKIQEEYLIMLVERDYDKDEILLAYLNTINLGDNVMGVEAASKQYFNKDVSDLTLSECAVLAAIPQNPSLYSPTTHPAKNKARRTTVLTCMKEQGYISADQYTEAMRDNVYDRIQKIDPYLSESSTISSYFTDALIDQVVQDLKDKCGYTQTQAYNALYTGGLTIYSTEDPTMQETVDEKINDPSYYPEDSSYQLSYQLTIESVDGVETTYSFSDMKKWFSVNKHKKISAYFKSKSKAKKLIRRFKNAIVTNTDTIISETIDFVIQPQVSFVLIDQHTGYVKALCGGRGDKSENLALNRATDTTEQPGSTLNILSAYLPALDTSGMTLATVQQDSPYYFPGTEDEVTNWSNAYHGMMSLRAAIAESVNVISVKTLDTVTPKTSYDYLVNLGLTTLVSNNDSDQDGKNDTDISLSLALGQLTKGVTNFELTAAYATIANEGVWHDTTFYTKVVDQEGNVLLDNTTSVESKKILKDSTAWLLTDTMKNVLQDGTGNEVYMYNTSGMAQAGKAGVSDDNKDLWLVGYTPYLTGGIWGGYDKDKKQTSTKYHKKLWRDIMNDVNESYTPADFTMPESITSATICTSCGKLAIDGVCDDTDSGSYVKEEYFSTDSVPTEYCDCH